MQILNSIQAITVIVAARTVDAMFTAAALLNLAESRNDIRIIYTSDLGSLPLHEWGDARIALIGFGPDAQGATRLVNTLSGYHVTARLHSIIHHNTAESWRALLGEWFDGLVLTPSPKDVPMNPGTCGGAMLHEHEIRRFGSDFQETPEHREYGYAEFLLGQANSAGQDRYDLDPVRHFKPQIGDDLESDRKRVYMTRSREPINSKPFKQTQKGHLVSCECITLHTNTVCPFCILTISLSFLFG